jgi:hypothetical protein
MFVRDGNVSLCGSVFSSNLVVIRRLVDEEDTIIV